LNRNPHAGSARNSIGKERNHEPDHTQDHWRRADRYHAGRRRGVAQGTETQQDACRPDVFRLCGNYIPDVGQIVACLRGNEPRLSGSCRQVMFAEPAVSEGYATRSRVRSNVE
jgi:hypothetical protein